MSNQTNTTDFQQIRLAIKNLLVSRQQNSLDYHIKNIVIPLSTEGLDTYLDLIEQYTIELLTIASGAGVMKGNLNISREDLLQASIIQERGVNYTLNINR